ncbi:hypothetical protein [Calothrix sp. 336/3]|uniref:hypothetical protein n=1 Tax=Calothrix sp. 336/3 TaxID=1337936 RepID=UPI0004E3C67F|nr:hypothetical protein [Calothrix sp. 336/3]AKG24151.1 hypothetical protein IJ00_25055 [Calothrix sp. 336/3]
MSIIALRAWYLENYEPIHELEKRPPDMRLSKKSLLKSALRADFLEDIEEIRKSVWFGRYLEGENIEFYIEGSGGYCVANIDLISHEIYFTKQAVLAQLEPTIFFSGQKEFAQASIAVRDVLTQTVESLNLRSRLPLKLVEYQRPKEGATRLSTAMLRKIRKSLLFVADITAIATIEHSESPQLIPSPQVCLEMGYAMQSKRSEQILLTQMQHPELSGKLPFDIPPTQFVPFTDVPELTKVLPAAIENQLTRFRLF